MISTGLALRCSDPLFWGQNRDLDRQSLCLSERGLGVPKVSRQCAGVASEALPASRNNEYRCRWRECALRLSAVHGGVRCRVDDTFGDPVVGDGYRPCLLEWSEPV